MANYCGKCGSKLDETGLCPNCDAAKIKQPCDRTTADKNAVHKEETIDNRVKKKALKARKKAAKKEKRAQWSAGKKVRRFFLKVILIVLFLAVLAAGITGTLVYSDMVNIPILSSFNQNSLLGFVNEKRIVIEEKNVVMRNETEGIATIVVTLPDYELLLGNSVTAENPDSFLLKALILKDYKTQEFELSAKVTVESGKQVIHTDEAVHQLLEECLVDAINALSEVG